MHTGVLRRGAGSWRTHVLTRPRAAGHALAHPGPGGGTRTAALERGVPHLLQGRGLRTPGRGSPLASGPRPFSSARGGASRQPLRCSLWPVHAQVPGASFRSGGTASLSEDPLFQSWACMAKTERGGGVLSAAPCFPPAAQKKAHRPPSD